MTKDGLQAIAIYLDLRGEDAIVRHEELFQQDQERRKQKNLSGKCSSCEDDDVIEEETLRRFATLLFMNLPKLYSNHV